MESPVIFPQPLQPDRHCHWILMLPDPYWRPAHFAKRVRIPLIAQSVVTDLRQPPLTVRFGSDEMYRTPVPEAAVYEHRNLHSHEDDVRTSGQIISVKTESNATMVQFPAQRSLRCGVPSCLGLHRSTNDLRGGAGTVVHSRREY